MSGISRVFIANRGEIALRIIRACKDAGIESVLAVSDADRDSLPARMADRAVCIGPARPQESYLKVETIVCAAIGTGSDAIHPGYGFLAEQPELPRICKEQGLAFIGPTESSLRTMGNKLLARKMVKEQGLPIIPGSYVLRNVEEAVEAAVEIGFPVIMKAAAGGGGRGIKIVRDAGELKTVFETSSAEARIAFGDEALYIEKYIPCARHIEVQILGDRMGNVIHLGERDCSLQRRYQKVIEEAPAPFISRELRENIRKAGVAVAGNIGYESAGTVEFILDKGTGEFYFLEMNTRIQVEHPVTEMVTGIDIVKEQIMVAAGKPLSMRQSDIVLSGHAIECRITAEDPAKDFMPTPGRLVKWRPPEGPDIRIDTHCYPGYSVPPFYDSLLAKAITRGKSREEAVERMKYVLANFQIKGVPTVIPFLLLILGMEGYKNGDVHTKWLESVLEVAYPRN
jgi:acetyl-CoA carboxylase biotin carboxylase subunit